MYERYYSMRSKAFPCQPTPSVFYESPIHKGALFYLSSGIEEREPFLLVTGEYGMGKTLLALRLKAWLQSRSENYVDTSTPIFTYEDLLLRIVTSLDIPVEGQPDAAALRNLLFNHFRQHAAEQLTLVIVLDEVQDLGVESLTKVRMLSSFNIDGHFPLLFVFFSHPDIGALLQRPELESLNQRLRRRFHLRPFNLEETKEYIYFRLLQSGASGSPYFPDESIELVHERSGGVPRFINNICDSALLIGAAQELDSIDPPVIVEAADAVVPGSPAATTSAVAPAEDAGPDSGAPPPPSPEAPAEETPQGTPRRRREGRDFDDMEQTVDPVKRTRRSRDIDRGLGRRVVWAAVIALLIAAAVYAVLNRQMLRETFGLSDPIPNAADTANTATDADTDIATGEPVIDERPAASQPSPPSAAENELSEPSSFMYGMRQRQQEAAAAAGAGEGTWSSPMGVGTLPMAESPRVMVQEETTRRASAAENYAPPQFGTGQELNLQAQAGDANLMGNSHGWSLHLATLSHAMEAYNTADVRMEEGIPDVYAVLRSGSGGAEQWLVYQGTYADRADAERAQQTLLMPQAAVVELPFALRVMPGNRSLDETVRQLRDAGHYVYYPTSGGHAGQPLVGAYPDQNSAWTWQQRLLNQNLETVPVRR